MAAATLTKPANEDALVKSNNGPSCWLENRFGRTLRMAASHYRFYYQRDGQTFAAEVLECDSDSDAMVKAKELLAMSTTFRLIEVWQGARKVGIAERG